MAAVSSYGRLHVSRGSGREMTRYKSMGSSTLRAIGRPCGRQGLPSTGTGVLAAQCSSNRHFFIRCRDDANLEMSDLQISVLGSQVF